MTHTATLYRHIELDENERPVIAGTRFKVYLLISFWQTNGWTAEDIHQHFPDLSMAQIYSAFAYYWDHKEAVDTAIQEADRLEAFYRQTHPEPPALERLRRLKRERQDPGKP